MDIELHAQMGGKLSGIHPNEVFSPLREKENGIAATKQKSTTFNMISQSLRGEAL